MKEFRWSDLTEEETKQMVDKALKHISENSENSEQKTIFNGDTKVNEQEILENMVKIADELNFGLDTNAIKIAKLKSRMDDWKRCPCDKQNPDRFCGSKLCQEDTIRDGWCHCHSYFRIDKQYNTK